MGTRPEFQTVLEGLGETSVYFQPPPSTQMSYPAIVYNRDLEAAEHADNMIYRHKRRYQVTVITTDPDSPLPDQVLMLPYSRFVRHFTTENLYHDIYSVYF